MVYRDETDSRNSKHSLNAETPLNSAPVLDRVFSFFLDYLIFSPVVSFLNFLVFKNEILGWRAAASSAEALPLLLTLGAYSIVVFALLQTVFIAYSAATPGQYFLKITVQSSAQASSSVPSQASSQLRFKLSGLGFLQVFIRQLGFWFSFLFFGIPFLAVMADPEGRTFYDRVSDIKIKSLKKNPFRFSFEYENNYWRSLIATFTVFLLFLTGAATWKNHTQIQDKAFTFEKKMSENHFCSEMKTIDLLDRLQVAVALNLVGQIDDACVDKEADFVLWNKNTTDAQKSLAYYAKSLTEDDDSTGVEKKYLMKACSGVYKPHLGCRIATAFENGTLAQFYAELLKDETKSTVLLATLKYELSMILDKTESSISHLKALKKFDSSRPVKKYILNELITAQSKGQGLSQRNRTPAASSGINSRTAVLKINSRTAVLKANEKYMRQLLDEL